MSVYTIETPTRTLRDVDDLMRHVVKLIDNPVSASDSAKYQTLIALVDHYTKASDPVLCPRCKSELKAPYRSADGKVELRDCGYCIVSYEVAKVLPAPGSAARLRAIHVGDERVNVNDAPLSQAILDHAKRVGQPVEQMGTQPSQVPSGVTFEEALDELIGKAREAGAASAIKTRMELDVQNKRAKIDPSARRAIRNDSKHADTGLDIGRRNFLKNWGRP